MAELQGSRGAASEIEVLGCYEGTEGSQYSALAAREGYLVELTHRLSSATGYGQPGSTG